MSRWLPAAALATVCIVWGTTYLGIRIAVETIPPMLLTSFDFLIAGAILLVIAIVRGDAIPRDRRTLANLALAGLLMVGAGNLAIIWGEQWVPSGLAALFVATVPLWMAVLEFFRTDGERHTRGGVIGLVLGFAGVAMLVTPDGAAGSSGRHFVIGALVMQLGSIAWDIGSIRSKDQLKEVALLPSSSLQMLIGGAIVGVGGIAAGEPARLHFTMRSLAALAWISIAGSIVGYTAYLYALAHMPTSRSSLYAYVNPIVAVILGRVVLNERMTWLSVVAMFVILAGVALVQSRPTPAAAASRP